MLPRPGDVLHVTRAASVQFRRPLIFRVIKVHDWPTYQGWVWLEGYELDATGDAVSRRSIYVKHEGLRQLHIAEPRPHTVRTRRPVARTPVRVG
ncbi:MULTISPECIES: hypothetical protein [Micromonospora]|uniref:Uncharacterized protein n=1 Tax=Micromonospora yangpuensis TaxID=683228 RepID=A0A1C6TWW3_9ACTN|nr:hypothetical protein [Micromonospora yangpuensis]GGM01690.1 hypothetical protein GCM10012279_19150 [Micromonospora yangpuensis]SCL46296.1 hypothetical protein GA0070617_0217 [Micromonospora yangpuensis]